MRLLEKQLVRLRDWSLRRSNVLIKDDFARRWLFGRKVFYFTLSGALVGGAVERAINAFRNMPANALKTIPLDIVSVGLIVAAGLLLAQIAKVDEEVERRVARRDDRGSVSASWLADFRDQERRALYPEVKGYFVGALLSVGVAVPFLVFAHQLGSPQRVPRVQFFECSPCIVTVGESSSLRWFVDGATEVFLDGGRVPVRGSRTVRPEQDTIYHLCAASSDGEAVEASVTIEVEEPAAPTSTPMLTPSSTTKPSFLPTPTDSDG